MASMHDGRRPDPTLGLERTQAIDGDPRPEQQGNATLEGDLGQTLGDDADDETPTSDDPPQGKLRRGDAIGRFVMLELLGVGGMGEVYLCYDPELDRRVAVKLLRPLRSSSADQARARLLREARSIARLSHPNVVTVHDVAVWQGRVFLAMEYIAGPTLAAWARDHAGDWTAIVAVYSQAGEGLAAAHRAGLVHRDFKPENVLVALEHGAPRPRVLDFGIARAAASDDELPDETAVLADTARGGDPSLHLTTTGMLLGTPAYMAPEQFLAAKVDPRTDQFSFCVALWEALHGQRPFAGDAFANLAANVLQGQLRPPPRDTRVPERLSLALRRGLAIEPDDRFPDMPALLAALAPASPTPRRWTFALAGLAIAGGVTAFAARHPTEPTEAIDPVTACTGDASLLAGTWDDPLRSAGAAAFARNDASATWAQVLRLADAWQTRWLAARARACADTHLHHRQSQPALDLRLACLDRQTRELAARATLWADADAELLRRAVESASALPRPESCDDAATRGATTPPPPAAEPVRLALARARALTAAGKYDAAVALTREQQSTAIDHTATLADLQLTLGRAQGGAGQPQPARLALLAATRLALQAGDDELALAAANELAAVAGIVLSHYDEGESWLQVAEGLAARLPVGREHVRLARISCNFLNDRLQLEAARPHCERALRLAESLDGPTSLATAGGLLGLANNQILTRHPTDARALLERAWQIDRELLGPRHPDLIRLANSRAAVEFYAGDLDAAVARWHEGLAIAEASVGRDHLNVGLIRINLAYTALEQRRWDRAERELAELERIYVPAKGELSSELVVLHFVRGRLALARGDLTLAREHFEQQHRFALATRSPDHPDVMRADLELGDLFALQGDLTASQQHHQAALALAEQHHDDESTALALRGLCRARVLLHRPADAIPDCERALPLAEQVTRGEPLRADLRAWLGRALVEAKQDVARGQQLITEARSELQRLGEVGRELLALHEMG
ncbi:MAG: protein kinase [Nannocystis sp.]|nr:protein kinase [Nannocystis sp.]